MIKNIWLKILAFFNTTKLGHNLKSAIVTFSGLFFGILFLNPLINELLKSSLPTIQQFSDVWPVVVDAFYRALWALFLVEIGVYKYSSSSVEINKSNIVPNKN